MAVVRRMTCGDTRLATRLGHRWRARPARLIEQMGDALSCQAVAEGVSERVVGCGLVLFVELPAQAAAGPGSTQWNRRHRLTESPLILIRPQGGRQRGPPARTAALAATAVRPPAGLARRGPGSTATRVASSSGRPVEPGRRGGGVGPAGVRADGGFGRVPLPARRWTPAGRAGHRPRRRRHALRRRPLEPPASAVVTVTCRRPLPSAITVTVLPRATSSQFVLSVPVRAAPYAP